MKRRSEVHVWKASGVAVCGESDLKDWGNEDGRPSVTMFPPADLAGATCLRCLRRLRDDKMREVSDASAVALEASAAYDREKRRRTRRKQ